MKRTFTVDGLTPAPARTIGRMPPHLSQPPAQREASPAPHPAQPHRTFQAPPQQRPRRRWYQPLIFPLCIVLCLCASFFVQSLPLGMAAIGVYAIVAWAKKLPSRYSFIMAFLALATAITLLVVRQNVTLASNFGTYTFLLLVTGVVSTMIESPANSKRPRSKITALRRSFRL